VRELNDLYQAVLLDHARHPRNHRRLENATAIGEGNDPLCGDRCKVYLDVAGSVIKDVSFDGAGCAIMLATASLMTLAIAGKTLEQAQVVAEQFRAVLMTDAEVDDGLGDLAALAGVRELPSRIKCAMLPWRSMKAALQNEKSRN
jgi:nitrogen fixation NifU-like protein